MPSPIITNTLALDRCPRCGIAKPHLIRNSAMVSGGRYWAMYHCSVCGGVVLASSSSDQGAMVECLPSTVSVSEHVPERAREYLKQAQESLAQPVASLMVSASAVDAMLKAKELKAGTLYNRIDQAAADHLITEDMAKWAHQVRLDANDQRHADEGAPLPTHQDAKLCLDFAMALAEFLFVLPARVTRGITETKK